MNINELRRIAHGTDAYGGIDAPVHIFHINDSSLLDSTSVTVYRIVRGKRQPFTAVAHYTELPPAAEPGRRDVRDLLAECAEARALAMAFPETASPERPAEIAPPTSVERDLYDLHGRFIRKL
jgi:hypothetical protein